MEASQTWSNRELKTISKYHHRMQQSQEQALTKKIVTRNTNTLDFYKITPKEELPKFLQKLKFQTVHLKEKDITKCINVFRKENYPPNEVMIRKKLKAEGQLMLLSEIYLNLGESGENHKRGLSLNHKPNEQVDFDQWEKNKKETQNHPNTTKIKKIQLKSSQLAPINEGMKGEIEKNNVNHLTKQLKNSSDYKGEVERCLDIIEMTHASQSNIINRYILIQNSSKLLKKEIDQKKTELSQHINHKLQLLFQARVQYHQLFEEKSKLNIEDQMYLLENAKEELTKISHKSVSSLKNHRSSQFKHHKKTIVENTSLKILKTKNLIETLEEDICQFEEELRKILIGEKTYYKITLKNGTDCRESGLGWVIKKLQIKEEDFNNYDYPTYLDKKSKMFLIQKSSNDQEEEQLLEEKRKFVNEIGKSSNHSPELPNKPNSINKNDFYGNDKIIEKEYSQLAIPKKFRRSLKKITLLNEEYLKNSSLLELREKEKKGIEISADLEGMSNKQIYNEVSTRIKRLDLSKIKKDKIGTKKEKLLEYQSLLEKIKNINMKIEEQDLQQEHHLLSHYKDNKDLYFSQAAACFGYKKAYSMIIKHFSWKNYHEST